MGIRDFFRRNKRSNEQVNYSEQQKIMIVVYNIVLE